MAASGGLEALHRQIRGVRAGSAGPATLPSAHRQAILPSNGPGVLTSCWHDAFQPQAWTLPHWRRYNAPSFEMVTMTARKYRKHKRYFLLSPALTDELQGSVWPPYLPPYWFEFPSLALCSADFHQLHSEIFPKFPALTPVRTIPRLPAKRLYIGDGSVNSYLPK